MAEVARTTRLSPEIINTQDLEFYNNKKAFTPERDEELEKNITLGIEELKQRKIRERRNILAVTIVIILLIIIVMFGLFGV